MITSLFWQFNSEPVSLLCSILAIASVKSVHFSNNNNLDKDDDDYYCDCDYNSVCIEKCVCFTGYVLVLLNVVNVISAVNTCYPVNGQQYCFHTDGSLLNWDEARQFCLDRNSTLPIVTDDDIDNVFQQFISENNLVEVSDSNTQQMNNYAWLDAHARQVSNSDPWHWINGQPSGSSLSCTVEFTLSLS